MNQMNVDLPLLIKIPDNNGNPQNMLNKNLKTKISRNTLSWAETSREFNLLESIKTSDYSNVVTFMMGKMPQ